MLLLISSNTSQLDEKVVQFPILCTILAWKGRAAYPTQGSAAKFVALVNIGASLDQHFD